MRNFIFVFPIGLQIAAQSATDNFSIEYTTHVWRKGIPDPPITNLDQAVECTKAPPQAQAVTHKYIWGVGTTAQTDALAALPQGSLYFEDEGWDRWSVLADNGLIEMPQPLDEL